MPEAGPLKDLTQQQLIRYAKDLKKTYDELTKKIKELEILNKKKTDFLDMTAHELQTPVTIIAQSASILISDKLDDQSKREYLGMFKKQVMRMKTIMSEIVLAN